MTEEQDPFFQRFYFSKPQLVQNPEGPAWICAVYFEQFGEKVKPIKITPIYLSKFDKDPHTWIAVSAFYDLLDNIPRLTMPNHEIGLLFHNKKVIKAIKDSEPVLEKMHAKLHNIPFTMGVAKKNMWDVLWGKLASLVGK